MPTDAKPTILLADDQADAREAHVGRSEDDIGP